MLCCCCNKNAHNYTIFIEHEYTNTTITHVCVSVKIRELKWRHSILVDYENTPSGFSRNNIVQSNGPCNTIETNLFVR